MKKYSILGLLILVGLTVFYFSPEEKAVVVKTPEKIKSKNIFLGKRTTAPATAPKASDAIDNCDKLRKALDEIDFSVSAKELRASLNLETIQACHDPEANAILTSVQQSCFEEKDNELCASHAVFLRSMLRTKGIENSDDKEQLADLILREFAKGMPNFKNLRNFSEKLMAMDPKHAAYQKLWAMSKLIARVEENKSPMDLADDIYGRVDPELWSDPQMKSVDVALKTGFDPQGVEGMLRNYLAQKEDSWTREILGWSLWKQGKKAQALENLKRAIELNPKDQWLQDQYKRVKSKGAGPDDYQARLSLGVSTEDLFY